MRWRALRAFDDPRIGKLYRLRAAARRGVEVPPTAWRRLPFEGPVDRPASIPLPLIVRSAASDEDGVRSTGAGRYESVVVRDRSAFADACRRVAASMGEGGAVFVQPLAESHLGAERAGVAFFDGFHYERTERGGSNRDLTAGRERGDVARADLVRGDAWSEWLARLGRVFASELRDAGGLDVEYARRGDRFVLLQARPAPFEVRRNPILSLANHREILGDHPSPWIVDALERAGRGAVEEFARVDPAVGTWGARYAEAHVGRAWLSFSFFFRLMDHWGLPRAFVTEGVGGAAGSPEDARPVWRRMIRKAPRLVRLQLQNLSAIRSIPRRLAEYDARLADALTVADWFEATAFGLDLALRTNFAINGALSGVTRVRRTFGVRGRARVVTEDMMEEYGAIRGLPEAGREAALDAWIARFGHRGPLESDPMQPRFAELRTTLLADVRRSGATEERAAPSKGRGGRGAWYALDRRREAFRDDLMLRWRVLREGTLAAAREAVAQGFLEREEDVFLLGGEAAGGAPSRWRAAVDAARERRRAEVDVVLPATARLDDVLRAASGDSARSAGSGGDLTGVGLGAATVRGVVRRADDLTALLREEADGTEDPLGPGVVLVVPALEPAWAVVFGRVGAVVTEIGGELSHASILLREAGVPALVDCAGVWERVSDGAEVTLDERAGTL
ncbi:MAG: PEP-utilizing enzyme, partial [Planctomycetota bacterium]